MTIHDVAEHLHVGWDLVKDIQHRYLSRKFRRGGRGGQRVSP